MLLKQWIVKESQPVLMSKLPRTKTVKKVHSGTIAKIHNKLFKSKQDNGQVEKNSNVIVIEICQLYCVEMRY